MKYIAVNTVDKKEKEKKRENEKNKEFVKKESFNEKKFEKNNDENNNNKPKKRNLILIKDLINSPYGKRRSILDMIRSSNLSTKSLSPTGRKFFNIPNDLEIYNKEVRAYTPMQIRYYEE